MDMYEPLQLSEFPADCLVIHPSTWPCQAGETSSVNACCHSASGNLDEAPSSISAVLPTLSVACSAASLGLFLLKGIQDKHSLCHIMPCDLPLLLQLHGKKPIACRLQRGKATRVEPPVVNHQPWTPQVSLLDVFSLPMIPDKWGGLHPDHAAQGQNDPERSHDSHTKDAPFSSSDHLDEAK